MTGKLQLTSPKSLVKSVGVQRLSEVAVVLFPLLATLCSLLALSEPVWFTWLAGQGITFALGGIMLAMGLSLTSEDFIRIRQRPGSVLLGLLLQFTVMPTLGYVISKIFSLPASLAAGLVLVSACPGGTASNVITFLARGDVALSVTMTSFSTIFSVVLTPLLASWLIGNTVAVNGWALFYDTVWVVVLPVTAGYLLRRTIPQITQSILPAMPLVAVLLITLIVASVIGRNRSAILSGSPSLFVSVFLLHSGGFLLGGWLSRIAIRTLQESRTISIEVGMQNSGLGVVLAQNNFADPLTALPAALSSLTHSIIGSLLAAVWRLQSANHPTNPFRVG